MLAGVELRPPTPDEPDLGTDGADGAGTADAPEIDPDQPVSWRVDSRLTIAKWAGALVFGAAAVIGRADPGQLAIAGIAAVLLTALALRDTLAPVRLAADPAGITVVSGYAGHRRFRWDQIERVRVDARRGMVVRSQVLELDTGDNLYFFGAGDLGAPCHEVASTLTAIRTGHTA